ncbi:hypothetical protein MPSEU_000935300 [Mayamaea pseudoterrestris]|nr:hypothetical protein MPSEU_000935300 [Mayamaea pseudoterrestris]
MFENYSRAIDSDESIDTILCSVTVSDYSIVGTTSGMMNPLVRDLYKRVIHVGRDYPTGLPHVRKVWKDSMRNRANCPACYTDPASSQCQEELFHAVNRGRFMVKEMIGVIKLKKYRAMKQRYDRTDETLEEAMDRVERLGHQQQSL